MKPAVPMKRTLLPAAGLIVLLLVFFAACDPDFHFDPSIYQYAPSVNLDRDYEWYASQMNTGPESSANCGPASVAMAVKYRQNKDMEVAEVRSSVTDKPGWWDIQDIKNALAQCRISYSSNRFILKEQLFHSLSEGHLVIIVLDMSLLTREKMNKESRYNRYYDGVTGHFIVLKGYTADQQWFLSYDPFSQSRDTYVDRTPKGKDRMYSVGEVVNSILTWNPHFIEL
jgi:hypothetical protein